jgi:hypothetical protein
MARYFSKLPSDTIFLEDFKLALKSNIYFISSNDFHTVQTGLKEWKNIINVYREK